MSYEKAYISCIKCFEFSERYKRFSELGAHENRLEEIATLSNEERGSCFNELLDAEKNSPSYFSVIRYICYGCDKSSPKVSDFVDEKEWNKLFDQ